MPRFFINHSATPGEPVVLEGEDARHIATVLRMKAREKITVCDFFNTEYTCEIEEARGAEVRLRVLSASPVESEPPFPITLCMALPKGDKMDLIVQKAVELGASEILPFTSAYTVVKPDERGREKKRERWQKIAKGAAEQCGRGRIPQIGEIRTFGALLTQFEKEEALKLFCYEREEGRTLAQAFQENPRPRGLVFFIGAEGGFDGKEAEAAQRAGFLPVSLGKRILRCETAPLFVLSGAACAYELM